MLWGFLMLLLAKNKTKTKTKMKKNKKNQKQVSDQRPPHKGSRGQVFWKDQLRPIRHRTAMSRTPTLARVAVATRSMKRSLMSRRRRKRRTQWPMWNQAIVKRARRRTRAVPRLRCRRTRAIQKSSIQQLKSHVFQRRLTRHLAWSWYAVRSLTWYECLKNSCDTMFSWLYRHACI